MKVCKKSALLLGMAMLSSTIITSSIICGITGMTREEESWGQTREEYEEDRFWGKTKEEVYDEILVAFSKLFYGTNLFDRKEVPKVNIVIEEFGRPKGLIRFNEWIEKLSSLRSYVQDNAGGNSKLRNAAELVFEVGNMLNNAIYDYYIPSSLPIRVENNIYHLLKDYEKLDREKKRLTSTIWLFPKRKSMKNLLVEVIDLLQETIERMVSDFIKESQKKGFGLSESFLEEVTNVFPDLL